MNWHVDWRASLALVGTVVKYMAVALLFPLVLAAYYGRDVPAFALTAAFAVLAGLALERLDDDPDMGAREGFLMVASTWFAASLVGALPYLIAGDGTVALPANALFESMSGFTTTGATVLGTIDTDTHSRAMMMWRQQTQWLGGMGIVVLAVAILPELSVGGAQLMDAEAPGPGIEKLTPRIAETAKALWKAYAGITVLEMVLLYGLYHAGMAPNMTLYNAVAHGFTTMATGGFSPEARSIEAFSAAVQWLVIPFMVAAGTNFALFWHALNGEPREFLRDHEFRFYVGILAVLSGVLAALLFVDGGLTSAEAASAQYDGVAREYVAVTFPVAGDVETALRHATFQVVSIVTTTGYATMDFNAWGGAGKYVLLFAMFVGGSAGSTGGAIKVVRWLVIVKSIRRELFSTIHPDAVRPVRLGGRALDERALRGIYTFTLLYLVLFFVGAGLLAVDVALRGQSFTAIELFTATAATLGNIGPGLDAVGPMNNYAGFSPEAKVLMVLFMWIGRLEIFPVIVLLTSAYWRS
jgi:trk system potassium uptake protein TrkH